MKLIKELRYYEEIDFIKAIAILFVLVLHTINPSQRLASLSCLHVYHAIPLFMIIAGVTGVLSSIKPNRIWRSLKRILIPYTIFSFVGFFMSKNPLTLKSVTNFYLTGSVGLGSYFTPVYIQFLFAFPVILWLTNKLDKFYSPQKTAIIFLSISLLSEITCVVLDISYPVYELLFTRYIFAVFLGIYIVKYRINMKKLLFLSVLNCIYILYIFYMPNIKLINDLKPVTYWNFQHSFGYFYSLLLFIGLWKLYPIIKNYIYKFNYLGKASYHIFLVQALYFWRIGVTEGGGNMIINLIICLYLGCLFYKNQPRLERLLKIR